MPEPDLPPHVTMCEIPHRSLAEEDACEQQRLTATQADLRQAVSAKLWEVAEQTITAEWICCKPLNTGHPLCAQGYRAVRMIRQLLVDSPGYDPAPLLDAVMGMLPTLPLAPEDETENPPVRCAAALMGRPHAPHSWQAEPGTMMVRCDGLVT